MTDPSTPPPPLPTPPPGAPGYGAPTPPARGGLPTWAVWAIIGAIMLVGGGVAALVLLAGGDDEEAAPVVDQTQATVVDTTMAPLPTESPVAGQTCTSAPPQPLISCVPGEVEQFTLVDWASAPEFASNLNANQAIEAEFRRSDGAQIRHFLFEYNTHAEARKEKAAYVKAFEATGFTVVGETRERGRNLTRLAGTEEVLVWSNGLLMGVITGLSDVTTGFFLELPY